MQQQTTVQRGLWGEEILPNVITIELEEDKSVTLSATSYSEEDAIRERHDEMKKLDGELTGLLQLHTDIESLLQVQTPDLDSIETATEKSQEKVKDGVLTLAEAARLKGTNIKMKCTLWGTGVGAAVGGVGGATVGLLGTPVLSVIVGAGGAVGGAGVGAVAGRAIGAALESVVKNSIDNELISLGRGLRWKPDEDKCARCSVALGKMHFRLRYHCCMCGRTFCWECCKDKIHIKYPGVKDQQLENICRGCKKQVRDVTSSISEKQQESLRLSKSK